MAARWGCVPFAWLALLACPSGQAQDKNITSRLNRLVDGRFVATRCPGLSVTVAASNEIVFTSALGMADVEQGVPLKSTSVHRLASLSKPITGTIMDLVSQGKLALDAPIRRYLPELPETYTDVTLRHLLDHQSGVGGDEGGDVAFSLTHYASSRDALKVFMDRPLKFKPGSKTEYHPSADSVCGSVGSDL